jgi:cellulose synthase/poly-beta-1,6-N-acetylglucosamine synthase-like glycosyltransferase
MIVDNIIYYQDLEGRLIGRKININNSIKYFVYITLFIWLLWSITLQYYIYYFSDILCITLPIIFIIPFIILFIHLIHKCFYTKYINHLKYKIYFEKYDYAPIILLISCIIFSIIQYIVLFPICNK